MNTLHTELFLLLLAIGAGGGFLSGLLGIGGGIIFVPALYACLTAFGIDTEHAIRLSVGTSLALILVTTASSAFWHNKKSAVDFSILKRWWPSTVLGVVAGTFFASTVDGNILKQFFAGTLLLISFYMALSKEPAAEPVHHRISKPVQALLTALIGMISAMIGVGGAILNIPLMTYTGVPMRKAVGTGSALGFIISFPAMIGYVISGLLHTAELPPYSFGYINFAAMVVILPLSMVLSPVGVHVSHKLPRNTLRRVFALVLIVVSSKMFFAS